METFTWRAVGQPTGTGTFRVLVAQFGDGYSQEAEDGINNETQSWPLQFAGTLKEIIAIRDFFRRHKGSRGFSWTTPLGDAGVFKVSAYSPALQGGDVWTISATFEQKFAP